MNRIKIESRSEKKYMLSYLLKDSSSELWKKLDTLDFKLSDYVKLKLAEMEDKVTIGASTESNEDFKKLLNKPDKFKTIQEVTKTIQKELDRTNFTFTNILPFWKRAQIETKIVKFYNFMLNFMREKDLAILFFSFCNKGLIKSLISSELGLTICGNNHQCMFLYSSWTLFNESAYKSGEKSSSDNFHTFVHEFGHGLLFYLSTIWTDSKTKLTFNRKNTYTEKEYNNCTDLESDKLRQGFSTDVICESYFRYVFSQFDFNPNEVILNKILNMVAVPSDYGRTHIVQDELVVEAFAYWYFTPEKERNCYWEAIHTFFSRKIWANYYLKN